MDLKYKQVKSGHFRPIFPVYLHYQDEEFGYEALLDSGADYNIFPSSIGRALGLDVKSVKEMEIGGIVAGEPLVGYVHQIEIEVIIGEKIKTLVVFADNISPDGYGVLGQLGFFNFYNVKFMYSLKRVRISRLT